MNYGILKVAAATPKVRVADVAYNEKKTAELITLAEEQGIRLVLFPELGLTACTCGDLFYQTTLLEDAKAALCRLASSTRGKKILAVVGLPFALGDRLCNVAAFLQNGEILGLVTKSNLPNHGIFREGRYFSSLAQNTEVNLGGRDIPIGPRLLFTADGMEDFSVAAEIGTDLLATHPIAMDHVRHGATLLVNPSALPELAGKSDSLKALLTAQSLRGVCGYLYANAGKGESTTDLVFGGRSLIYENGRCLAETPAFHQEELLCADLDVAGLRAARRRMSNFSATEDSDYRQIFFHCSQAPTVLERPLSPTPFIPADPLLRKTRCEEVLAIQSHGLQKRLEHIGLKTVTIGISGGLDSTLALLVTAKAFDNLGLDRKGIIAVTMPCFGTSDRTYQNAKALVESLGASLREINIKAAVTQHLSDIGADLNDHDVTYENAQARERTQVLMDIANKSGGIVIGTGDLSELALGFATYNGDHMSMYGVNASVPKTLMRHLVRHLAEESDPALGNILIDIVETPVSPELLPPDDRGTISQQTEDIVGPYELHDFFLYYSVRAGFSKEKILHLATHAFAGQYTKEIIEKWLEIFLRRFRNSQFKRSCLPDGPKVGSVGFSPRGDWQMPSDSCL